MTLIDYQYQCINIRHHIRLYVVANKLYAVSYTGSDSEG